MVQSRMAAGQSFSAGKDNWCSVSWLYENSSATSYGMPFNRNGKKFQYNDVRPSTPYAEVMLANIEPFITPACIGSTPSCQSQPRQRHSMHFLHHMVHPQTSILNLRVCHDSRHPRSRRSKHYAGARNLRSIESLAQSISHLAQPVLQWTQSSMRGRWDQWQSIGRILM